MPRNIIPRIHIHRCVWPDKWDSSVVKFGFGSGYLLTLSRKCKHEWCDREEVKQFEIGNMIGSRQMDQP